MERIGIAQVQKRVALLKESGWPIQVTFSTQWRITIAGATSPIGLTSSTQLWQWLDAVETGVLIAPSIGGETCK